MCTRLERKQLVRWKKENRRFFDVKRLRCLSDTHMVSSHMRVQFMVIRQTFQTSVRVWYEYQSHTVTKMYMLALVEASHTFYILEPYAITYLSQTYRKIKCWCPPFSHGYRGLIIWDVHKNGNILLGLTVCDIHTNGNVFLGFTVWDVHTNENNWVSMPRQIAHELILPQPMCQEGLSPTVSGSCGKDPLSPTLTWRRFQMRSRKGVKNHLYSTDAYQWFIREAVRAKP